MSGIKDPSTEKGKNFQARKDDTEAPNDNLTPVFCFQHLQKKYCISKCQKNEKAALADRLKLIGQNTWGALRNAPRHGLGYEIIKRSKITASIPDVVTQDTKIIAFRFCALAPVVGFRNNRIFHVLWLDRAFTLYDHG
jgi:hypothetical protein